MTVRESPVARAADGAAREARIAVWPSLDLASGKVVRLRRGEAGTETVYDVSPESAARRFEEEGADGIHVVDLDAAFARGENRAAIRALLGVLRIPVQVGGGLRSEDAVRRAFDDGAARVVLGSLPFTDPALFARLVEAYGARVVVALDCKEGRPTTRGWTEDAGAGDAASAARRIGAMGVTALLVTDVARDGLLAGPNLELLASVRAAFGREVIASGGMRGEADLRDVDGVLAGGPRGAIYGKALHEGLVTVARLAAAARGREAES